MVQSISEREFELYTLSLSRGHNFEEHLFYYAWKSLRGDAVGAVLIDPVRQTFRALVLRRRVDHRFIVTHQTDNHTSASEAAAAVEVGMRPDDPPERLPPGAKRRPELFTTTKKDVGEHYKVLTITQTHFPASITVGEVYLAMPKPDDNFVSDFQTENFDSRLWELYLLACFREQGLSVQQDYLSPDFYIERNGCTCWVEAVTANSPEERVQGFTSPVHAPENQSDRLLGAPAARYAKTIRSKLDREYNKLSHVQDSPFALAISDFHVPSAMVWSREALPCYLYGVHPQIIDDADGRRAVMSAATTLKDDQKLPAGLFRDPAMSHLSAVIFSNAATFSKFNRMGFLAGWQPQGLVMVRDGILFDRTPGSLEPKSFKLDVLSDEYAALWPNGEAWCQELEVFHNPQAKYPLEFDLLPGATHWFESDGELICITIWEWFVLSSVTHLYFKA